jgi:hypothetical protein
MLLSQGLRAANKPAASVSYRANYSSITNASSYTFTSCDIGTEAGRDQIVIAVHTGAGGTVDTVTVGGSSATRISGTGAGLNVALWRVGGVTGSTATIEVTMPSTADRCLIAVYALYDLLSVTPIDSDSTFALSGSSSLSRTIDTRNDGVIIAMASSNAGSRTFTWTGVTENYDVSLESAHSYSGGSGTSTSNTTTTVSFTIAGGGTGLTFTLASWR